MSEPRDLIGLDEIADLLRAREGPPRPARSRRRSRAWIAAAAAVAVLGVAAGIATAVATRGGEQASRPRVGSSAAACAAAVEWHGTTYFGQRLRQPAKLGRSLGAGVVPGCDDGGGSTPDQPVDLVAIAGVPPEQAVAVAADPGIAYVSPGWLSQIPHTPLHDLLYGARATAPNERAECEPAHTTTAELRARIRVGGAGGLAVTLLGPTTLPRENEIFPDARTVVTGGGSPPHVEPGELIRAEVLVCRHAGDPHFLKLVATRLWLGD